MLLAVASFAIMNVAIKYLIQFSAMELVFYRALITLVISGFFLYKRKISIRGRNTFLLVLRGVFGFFGLYCYYLTVHQMNLATAVILQYTSPIFTVLIALAILGERVLKIQWLGFLICLCGLFMIKQFGEIDPFYFGLGILSALFSGAAYNVIRKLKISESANLIVFYFPLVTLPISIIVLLYVGKMYQPTWVDIFWIMVMGVTTQIAQYAMTKAYQKDTAARISSISYTGLGYALFFGFVLFKEKPNQLELIGFLIIIIGVLVNIYANGIKSFLLKIRAANP